MLPRLILGFSRLQLHKQMLAAVPVRTITVPVTVVGVAPYVRHSLAETVVGVVRYSSSEAKGSKSKKQKKRGKAVTKHPTFSNSTVPEKLTEQIGDALEGPNILQKDAASTQEGRTEKPEEILHSQDAPDFYTLIANSTVEYANPLHLGRHPSPPSPQQGSITPSSPLPVAHTIPKEKQTSYSSPTTFPTTSATKRQNIVFASTRLNRPTVFGASEEKDKGQEMKKLGASGVTIAGIKVPPKPEEPDNCCMSGCVNCVWDLYREDLEHYTSQKRLAEQQLHHLQPKPLPSLQTPGDSSIGEDRGDVFRINDESEWLDNKDIPMGIRVFMAMEKQLKARKKDMI